MAKTLLDAVNQIFMRVNAISGDAAALTSLTDSARQHPIDVAIQVVNEGIDALFTASHISLPKSQAESTITLATNTREYNLATDLTTLYYPFRDVTNSQYIFEFKNGYNNLVLLDVTQTWTGLPQFGVISPITGKLRVDRAPTSVENGRVYTYEYEKDLALSLATDNVPFGNACFRAMVPAWVQLYNRGMRNEMDQALYSASLGRASRLVTEIQQRTTYSPRP